MYTFKLGCPSHQDFENLVNPKVSTVWYELGIQLGVPHYTLDEIKCNNKDDVRGCCREAFKYWCNSNTYASWKDLLKALESDSVGRASLAEDIRRKLLPGKLYWLFLSTTDSVYMCSL